MGKQESEQQGQRRAALRLWSTDNSITAGALVKALGAPLSTVKGWVRRFRAGRGAAHAAGAGRPRRMSQQATAAAVRLIKNRETGSAAKVAAALAAAGYGKVHRSTVRRALRRESLVWNLVQRRPALTAQQEARRLVFAGAHDSMRWQSVMFSDSKYFAMYPTGGRLGVWRHAGEAVPVIGIPKHNPAAHVYMGMTRWGLTGVYVVSGGSSKSSYSDSKGQRYRGVCAAEYQQDVLPKLIADGNALFAKAGRYGGSWVFQQDGARIHTTVASLREAGKAPGGVLYPWPANSPDLNLIENVWAFMAQWVREQPVASDFDDFVRLIKRARAAVPSSMLKHCYRSMPRRLREVIAKGGAAL